MRAFIYCRVSTQEQATDDHYSLANQEARCRDYIKHRSWQLVKVLRDVGSGKSAERPSYQDLLLAIREKRLDVVVVYRLDRLSRNVVDVYNALDAFSRHDVGFASVQEAFDTTTAMGRAMLGVAAVFAQLTREMISENTKDGLARRAQSGKYLGSPHSRPYGYRFADGRLSVIEAEADVVRRLFRLHAEQGWSISRLTRLLNAEGLSTVTGLVGGWNTSSVAYMLCNPVYLGRIRHSGKEFAGEHDAIVTAEVFEAAQELQRQRSAMAPRAKTSPHLLSSLARCGECGRTLGVHYTKVPGRTEPYASYRHGTLRTAAKCLSIQRATSRLEQPVIEQVRLLATSPRLREETLKEARRELKAQTRPTGQQRERLLVELADGERTFGKWVDRLDRGVIDEEQFANLNREYLANKKLARERIEQLERDADRVTDLEVSIGEVEAILDDFAITWDTMTLDEQRECLRSLVEYLKVYEDRLELKLVFMPEVVLPLESGRNRKSKADAKEVGE